MIYHDFVFFGENFYLFILLTRFNYLISKLKILNFHHFFLIYEILIDHDNNNKQDL